MSPARAIAVVVGVTLGCMLVAAPAHARPNACILRDLGLPLAGKGVVDCGVAASGNARQRRGVARCAQRAIAKGKPVRFGVGELGLDSFSCDVAVRDAQGQFYSLNLEWEVGYTPVAFVGRCPVIDPDWKDPSGADHFGPRECVFDEDAFKRAAIRHP